MFASVLLVLGVWCLEAWGAFVLPPATDDIDVHITHPNSYPGGPSYWGHIFSGITSPSTVLNGVPYVGWCVDELAYLLIDGDYTDVKLYSSYAWPPGGTPDAEFHTKFHTSGMVNGMTSPVAWSKVNWILNNYREGDREPPLTGGWANDYQAVQAAIWRYVNGGAIPTGGFALTLVTEADAWYAANGRFRPDVGEVVAVAVYIDDGANRQGTIIEVETDEWIPVELSSFTAASNDGKVALEWVTQTETESLGFHVYRSLSEAGKYEKITVALIEGAGSARTTRTYQFMDPDVEPGKTYYYKLEQLDFDGTSEMYGPAATGVVAKPAALQRSTWGQVKMLLQ
jgi:hypothetical protein